MFELNLFIEYKSKKLNFADELSRRRDYFDENSKFYIRDMKKNSNFDENFEDISCNRCVVRKNKKKQNNRYLFLNSISRNFRKFEKYSKKNILFRFKKISNFLNKIVYDETSKNLCVSNNMFSKFETNFFCVQIVKIINIIVFKKFFFRNAK